MHSFSLICEGHFFIIPTNQRGYSWGRQQVDAVFSDLRLAGTNSHYMGSVIVSRTDKPDFQDDQLRTTAEFYLEDGQQRIMTFFLIANALRITLGKDTNPDIQLEAKELERLIFYKQGGALHLRVKNSNDELHQMLNHLLAGAPQPARQTPPMSALKDAYEMILGKLNGESPTELQKWKQRICNQAKFIWIDLKSEGIDRYLAFDAINSRGLPLSEFDKIKNFCILITSKWSLATKPEDAWFDSIEKLQSFGVGSRSQEAAYTALVYSVYFGKKVTENEVHAKIVSQYHELLFKRDVSKEASLVEFVSTWSTFANSLGLLATDYDRSAYVGSLITATAHDWLLRLDHMELPGICRPLLMASHIRFSNDEFSAIVRACEIYTFRTHAVAGRRKDSNSVDIVDLAFRVFHSNATFSDVLTSICKWLRSDPASRLAEVLNELASGKAKYYYDEDVKGWPYCYYFLYEYELANSPQGVSPLRWRSERTGQMTTIEHIMPQKHRDNGAWEVAWPNEAEANAFKHRLGNLTLTSDNRALGRKWIADKLNDPNGGYGYRRPDATNSEKIIVNYTDGGHWNREDILARELDMMKFAAARWSLPCSSDLGFISLPKIEGQPPGWDNLVLPAIDACVMDSDSITPAADESDDEDPSKI
jgi:Protein of unknown function DUF262/Protein of unknown function (DUF1524)